MKLRIFFLSLFIFPLSVLFSQEGNTVVDSYIRNFTRATLETKVQILDDAGQSNTVAAGPLYDRALDFILSDPRLLETNQMMKQLAILSTKYIGLSGYAASKNKLWNLFKVDRETSVRLEIMNTLGKIAAGDAGIIENMNSWLSAQNTSSRDGVMMDLQVISACVIALGKLGDPSSFPVLFTAKNRGYSNEITSLAEQSLKAIRGNYKDLITGVIKKNVVSEKVEALSLAMESSTLTDEEKGDVAETALETALDTATTTGSQTEGLRELRYQSILALTRLQWSGATPAVIDNFNTSVLEYDKGLIGKPRFLASMDCLGAMKTPEAASRLNLYLGLLNSYIEGGQKVDEQVALSVIGNLGLLGDQVASDNLLFVQYIDYSNVVKKAAREAFSNLKRR